jgi:hypothetical protein
MSMHEVVLVVCLVISLFYPSYNETFSSAKFFSLYQFVFLNQHDRSVIEPALLKAYLPARQAWKLYSTVACIFSICVLPIPKLENFICCDIPLLWVYTYYQRFNYIIL